MQKDDTFIVDRGCRDCVEVLENKYGFQVKMPALLSKNEKQLNTKEANGSRFVTKLRWVVEVINTFLKNSFKALKQVPNISLPHTLEDYKIAAALINRFFKRLFSDQNDHKEIAENMKLKLDVENELEKLVKNDKLN